MISLMIGMTTTTEAVRNFFGIQAIKRIKFIKRVVLSNFCNTNLFEEVCSMLMTLISTEALHISCSVMWIHFFSVQQISGTRKFPRIPRRGWSPNESPVRFFLYWKYWKSAISWRKLLACPNDFRTKPFRIITKIVTLNRCSNRLTLYALK